MPILTTVTVYSRRNQHFYIDKCGFAAVAMRDPQDEEHGMFVLQKRMPGWAEEI